MNKQTILTLCEQIIAASECIISVGTQATAQNAPQLMGICRAARQIAAEVNKPEPNLNEEVP